VEHSERDRRRALCVASAGYFFVLPDVTIVNVALAGLADRLGARRLGTALAASAAALLAGGSAALALMRPEAESSS
jgi:hypothetical protein